MNNKYGPQVAGTNASDRIMKQLDNRLTGEPKPTKLQVAMVLHALADHTAIMAMVEYDRMGKEPQGEDPNKETAYWPTETSIGRWMHAVGNALEDSHDLPGQECPRCKGKGKNPDDSVLGYPGHPCYYCDGTGRTDSKPETINNLKKGLK